MRYRELEMENPRVCIQFDEKFAELPALRRGRCERGVQHREPAPEDRAGDCRPVAVIKFKLRDQFHE